MNAGIIGEIIIVTSRYYSILPVQAQFISHLNLVTVQILISNTSQRLSSFKYTPSIQNNNSQQLWVLCIVAVLSCTLRCKYKRLIRAMENYIKLNKASQEPKNE